VVKNSLCGMMARLSVIFGDGTNNFLEDDLLTDALRSIREVVDVAEILRGDPPTDPDDLLFDVVNPREAPWPSSTNSPDPG
jgi:hypothetical protein